MNPMFQIYVIPTQNMRNAPHKLLQRAYWSCNVLGGRQTNAFLVSIYTCSAAFNNTRVIFVQQLNTLDVYTELMKTGLSICINYFKSQLLLITANHWPHNPGVYYYE